VRQRVKDILRLLDTSSNQYVATIGVINLQNIYKYYDVDFLLVNYLAHTGRYSLSVKKKQPKCEANHSSSRNNNVNNAWKNASFSTHISS